MKARQPLCACVNLYFTRHGCLNCCGRWTNCHCNFVCPTNAVCDSKELCIDPSWGSGTMYTVSPRLCPCPQASRGKPIQDMPMGLKVCHIMYNENTCHHVSFGWIMLTKETSGFESSSRVRPKTVHFPVYQQCIQRSLQKYVFCPGKTTKTLCVCSQNIS